MLNELIALREKYESELLLAQARVDVAKDMIATLEQKLCAENDIVDETETDEQQIYGTEV